MRLPQAMQLGAGDRVEFQGERFGLNAIEGTVSSVEKGSASHRINIRWENGSTRPITSLALLDLQHVDLVEKAPPAQAPPPVPDVEPEPAPEPSAKKGKGKAKGAKAAPPEPTQAPEPKAKAKPKTARPKKPKAARPTPAEAVQDATDGAPIDEDAAGEDVGFERDEDAEFPADEAE
jgi:outer membrane biosynthesis protein TonB